MAALGVSLQRWRRHAPVSRCPAVRCLPRVCARHAIRLPVAVRLRLSRHSRPRDRELDVKMRLVALLAGLVLLWTVPNARADPPATLQPGVLTVGVNMPSPGFQVGAVRGHGVVYARGLEIDLANALAARLGIPRVVFYQEPQFARLIAPGPKPWDIALAEVTITPERSTAVAFSIPYLSADQGVLLRRGLASAPRTIAQLARLRICTKSSTTSAALVRARINPSKPPRYLGNTTLMLNALQAGRC